MKEKSRKIISAVVVFAILISVVLALVLVDIDMNNAIQQGKNDAYMDMQNISEQAVLETVELIQENKT